MPVVCVDGEWIINFYLFRPPMTRRRSGQSLERAMAVEPPTRPVPPSTNTLEFRVFSGSWILTWSLLSVARAVGIVASKCSEAPAMTSISSLSLSRSVLPLSVYIVSDDVAQMYLLICLYKSLVYFFFFFKLGVLFFST